MQIPEGGQGGSTNGAEGKAQEWRQSHDSESRGLLTSKQDDTHSLGGELNKRKHAKHLAQQLEPG